VRSFATPFCNETTEIEGGATFDNVTTASSVSCDFIARKTTSSSRQSIADG
jgi:hypothetical protein